MESLDFDTAIAAGGWDARFARILDIATLDDWAAVLVDPNGDGADLNLDLYRRLDGTWVEMLSGNGAVFLDDVYATWDDEQRVVLAYNKPSPI